MLAQNHQGMKYASELRDLMDARLLYCVYQPIFSLTSGCVVGWEALLRGPEGSKFHRPDQIFRVAQASDFLAEIEIIGHRAAVSKAGYLGPDRRLFLKVHPHVIQNAQFVTNGFVDYLAMFDMTPHNIVFEITERQYVDDYKRLIQKIDSLRSDGFSIAVDDVGSGYAGLQAIAEIRPDYLKIDMSLVHNIHKDRVKRAVLEMLVSFTEKIGGGIIAEGIESEKELYAIMNMNIHFGQGYFIGKPLPVPEISGNIAICMGNGILNNDGTKIIKQVYPVGDFSEEAVCADHKVPVKNVKHLFDINPSLSGIVITDGEHPVGLLMRHYLDSHLGKKYGFSLYSERAVSTLTDSSALMVDENTAIEKVSQAAMNRRKHNLYDHIIVTGGGLLKGVVSVQTLLEMLTRMRVEMAKGANPLTGLPGNLAIENELRRRQNAKQHYAVVFVDIDRFKSLNDRYGFEVGDEVILFTARLLKGLLNKYAPEKHFLGHIGGDDFLFIVSVEAAEHICQKTIRYFDYLIKRFYEPQDLNEGKILCVDRDGEEKWIPIVSISMVILDIRGGSGSDLKTISTHIAQLKKYAKSLPGSVFVRDRREKDKPAVSDPFTGHMSQNASH